MSLASPLSVGDIILLGKIAYRVGTALSSGANSAPTEFAEVQSLLFSLQESFEVLSQMFAEPDTNNNGGIESPNTTKLRAKRQPDIANILNGCRDVLLHLEKVVERYAVLDSSSSIREPRPRRLRLDFKKGWKKVAWTTEGGDISRLKQALIAHSNALHLAIAVVNG